MAVPEHHIREALSRYVSGEISLVEFQEWFIPRAWEAIDTGAPVVGLVSDIELLLAEFSNADFTESVLRQALKPHATVPSGGSVYIDQLTQWVGAAVWASPWTRPLGGMSRRWATSVAGADLGSTTVELRRHPSPLDTPRVSKVEQAA